MPLYVVLRRWGGLKEKELFANCVAVILPCCAVSALTLLARDSLPAGEALPYLIGGAAGGLAGGILFRRVPGAWLRRGFSAFLLYGAWRYLR